MATKNKSLNDEIKRLETALDSLARINKEALGRQNQRSSALSSIKAEYDSLLRLAENLLEEVEKKSEKKTDGAERKGSRGLKDRSADEGDSD